ncbi:transposase [uncultured Oscillibacter sp.]|uniref:transposase n=1 Tax=uncultured Oscillibacter sp. TaxID=876091 RepID=UPI00262C57A2|nr:transposase [uncultured Oscillibacter sp.]
MRNKSEQMSLFDTYKGVTASMEEDKPKLFRLLDEHIDWDTLVPARFYMAFYQNTGRPRKYPLVAFLKSLVLQKIFCYVNDSVLLVTLRHSREMRKFCGFSKVPDAAKLTRFKQDFLPYIMEVFERLVELTEPICREMDAELAGSLIYDTTGIESYVAENNPKFFSSKLRQAKLMAKTNPNTDPYRTVYGLLPDCAAASPAVKQQYINGHFCYAQKAGLLTNGLGIVRHIAFFDDAFKKSHPEIPIDKRTDNPDADKELGDSRTLLPVLRDFKLRHPGLHYKTFLGDAAFDSYDTYSALLREFQFERAVIPMSRRNTAGKLVAHLDENGIPLCPNDGSQLKFHSVCGGKNRSMRLKFICPETERVKSPNGTTWRCRCDQPCSASAYGRCVYIYPDADLRLYPGILRGSDQWAALYAKRTAVERSIGSFKHVLGLEQRKTSNSLTTNIRP